MEELHFPRLLQPQTGSFFLFGPRGCGKSTWLARSYPAARTVDLLDEARYQSYLAEPGLFFDGLVDLHPGSWVSVDEIQRLPQLLNEVHRLIEQRRLKFVLTGSSARKLRRTGVNLLGGRALRRLMYPLTPVEMGTTFQMEAALRFGTLPLVVQAASKADTLTAYVQMYLKEEIQAEALVRNLPGFSRFLPVAALFHGQVLNLTNVARDAGITRSTAQGFFEILEDTLIAARLPALDTRLRVREKRHPKFYWVDPGIVRAARRNLQAPSAEEQGALLEGFVHMLLCCQRDLYGEIDEISYWSPAGAKQTEVDFVLKKGAAYIAVEVKAVQRLRPEHLAGLEAIAGLPGLERRILVYLGRDRLTKSGSIEVLPFAQFVRLLEEREL